MNALTPHVQDDEERHRIASRSPIDVFAPTPDPEQYVSDYSGNYWPYRAMTYREANDNPAAAERTVNRSLRFRLIDERPPGHNFPADLYTLADELHADEVLPVVYTGTGRDMLRAPVETYTHHDFTAAPKLIIPAPAPHDLTLSCLTESLYSPSEVEQGVRASSHPTDVSLRELHTIVSDGAQLTALITTARDAVSGDINVHLQAPHLNADLVHFIRNTPNAVDSIVLSDHAQSLVATPNESTPSLLSSTGESSLSDSLCPSVRVAAELSLLCSSYISDAELPKALSESVIPHTTAAAPQNQTRPTNPQQTLSGAADTT